MRISRKRYSIRLSKQRQRSMLVKLQMLKPADETYNAKLQVLGDLVKHHVKEEETELFKQARALLNEAELKTLGEKMAGAKERLLAAKPR
jgi:hypothetical protein